MMPLDTQKSAVASGERKPSARTTSEALGWVPRPYPGPENLQQPTDLVHTNDDKLRRVPTSVESSELIERGSLNDDDKRIEIVSITAVLKGNALSRALASVADVLKTAEPRDVIEAIDPGASGVGIDQPLPDTPPELYNGRADRSEKLPDFLRRVYGPWLNGSFTREILRKLDPNCAKSLDVFVTRYGLPADLNLPTRTEGSGVTRDQAMTRLVRRLEKRLHRHQL